MTLREHAALWRICFIAADLGLSAGVFLLSYCLRFQPAIAVWLPESGAPPPAGIYLRALPAVCLILLVTNSRFRLYRARRISRFPHELADLLKSNAMAVLLLLAYFFFHREASYSRSIVAMFALLNPAAAFLFRLAVRGGLRFLRARGRNLRAILIVGTGRTAQALLHRLRRNAWTGMRVRGLVSLSPADTGRTIHGVPVIGAAGDLARLVREHPVDQVFIALPLHEQEAVERVIAALSGALIPLRVVVDPGFLLHHRVTMDFDGLRIVNLWENHLVGWNATLKLLLDLGVAAVALVVLAPVFLAIALAIKLTERGPVFWVQERMGHDGRTFRMLKFRTMRPGSEDDTRFTQPGDPRCTRVGRFLRRTSLDELPQLLNVLRGEMSLVGPRPERPVFVAEFQRTMPRYMLRHKAKAGITGWAQVNGWRGATSLRKRLQYDLDYLHNWSLALDLKILAMTLVRVFTQRNAY